MKTFVLDTSVILSAGSECIRSFGDNEVVIPLVVVEELESKRNDPQLGFNARDALRLIFSLMSESGDKLSESGVKINDQNGTLRIELNNISYSGLPDSMSKDHSNDTRILAVANNLMTKNKNDVVLVSHDLPMMIKSQVVLGIKTERYSGLSAKDRGLEGYVDVDLSDEDVSSLMESKEIPIPDCVPQSSRYAGTGIITRFLNEEGESWHLGVITDDETVRHVGESRSYPRKQLDVRPKNVEQALAWHHLNDDEKKIVSMGGPAGTGKTLLALYAGFRELKEHHVSKIIVFRPIQAVGRQELGYLPGTADEKMSPWAEAIYDAMTVFCQKTEIDSLRKEGKLDILPVTHLRGRTLNNAWVLIEEAQNLELVTLKTILSRLGQGSKAVMSWDIDQRDNTYLGPHEGVVVVNSKLHDNPMYAHVEMKTSERSEVAELINHTL